MKLYQSLVTIQEILIASEIQSSAYTQFQCVFVIADTPSYQKPGENLISKKAAD